MPNVSSETLLMPLGTVRLDSGAELNSVEVAYEVYGTLSPARDNVVLLCHALTGSARAAGPGGWWDPLVGPGCAFDTDRYAVVCSNFLGSCYGTTGPRSVDPALGFSRGAAFPSLTVGDMVQVQRRLLLELGVERLSAVSGGSLGGLQVLEWAARFPAAVEAIIPIASSLAHSAWTIAFNECARQAIRNDPMFFGGDYQRHGAHPDRGLELARMIAMISYRSAPSFQERFGRRRVPAGEDSAGLYEVESYLHYQGVKLVERFDANAYLRITEAMDAFDVGAGRGGPAAALRAFQGPALVMGIDSDVLYPTWEQAEMVRVLRGNGNPTTYREIHSSAGHDAFLIEWDQLDSGIREFLATG